MQEFWVSLLLLTTLWDAFETIILPRRVTRQYRLVRLFYRVYLELLERYPPDDSIEETAGQAPQLFWPAFPFDALRPVGLGPGPGILLTALGRRFGHSMSVEDHPPSEPIFT